MGNAKTLAMIAKAADKLPLVDPEYAARLKANRRERRWRRLRRVEREFKSIVERYVDNIPDFQNEDSDDFIVSGILENDNRPFDPAETVIVKSKPVSTSPGARKATRYAFNGKDLTLREWAAETGIPANTLYSRLRTGATVEKAVTTSNSRQTKVAKPVKVRKLRGKLLEYNGEQKSVAQLAKDHDIQITTLGMRLKSGWSLYDALNVAVRFRSKMPKRQKIDDMTGGWVETSSETLGTGPLGTNTSLPKQDVFQ